MADSAYIKYRDSKPRTNANSSSYVAQHNVQHNAMRNLPAVSQNSSAKSAEAINYSTSSAKTIAFKSVSVHSANEKTSRTQNKVATTKSNSSQTTRLRVVKRTSEKCSVERLSTDIHTIKTSKRTPPKHHNKPTDAQRALVSLDDNVVSNNLGKSGEHSNTSDTIEALKYAAELFAMDTLSHTEDTKAGLRIVKSDSNQSQKNNSSSSKDAALKYLHGLHESNKIGSRKKDQFKGKHSKNNKNDKNLKRANDDFDKFITTNFEEDDKQEDTYSDEQDGINNSENPDTSGEEGSAAAARYTNRKKKSRRQKRKEERERRAAIEANKKPLFETMDSANSRSGRKASEKANTSQRKIIHSFAGKTASTVSAADSIAKRASRSIKLKGVAVVLLLVLVAAGILYPAAREYYVSVRNLDKANIYLAQLQERNDQLQNNIDALSTDDGIENYARAQYGWVKNGEEAVSVIGLPTNSQTTTLSTASTRSIQEDKSAFTALLDAIFFVN